MAQQQGAYRKIGLGVALVALPVGAAVTAWTLRQQESGRNAELEKSFNYDNDVQGMRQVDPALVAWRETGHIDAGVAAPRCFAIAPGGEIIVGGEQQVRILSGTGEPLRSITLPGTATAITSDARQLYVAMKDRIAVFGLEGSSRGQWEPLESGSHITSLSVSGEALYAADAGRRVGRALKYGLDGKLQGPLAKQDADKGIPGIVTPSAHMDVAVAADGNVWVANPGRHQLELYSPTGELLSHWGSAGTTIDTFLGCCNPSDFALLSDGRLVTAEKGIARVKIYAADGHFQGVVATPEQFGGNRAGIDLATDASGRILLLEPGTRSIRIFEPKSEASR